MYREAAADTTHTMADCRELRSIRLKVAGVFGGMFGLGASLGYGIVLAVSLLFRHCGDVGVTLCNTHHDGQILQTLCNNLGQRDVDCNPVQAAPSNGGAKK